jgi:hypothetical protein
MPIYPLIDVDTPVTARATPNDMPLMTKDLESQLAQIIHTAKVTLTTARSNTGKYATVWRSLSFVYSRPTVTDA